MQLLTIGHSNHPAQKLVHLLDGHGIDLLVDVRSMPYSRYNPQFNKKALEQLMLSYGKHYVYAGEALGGRPKDPTCYRYQTMPRRSVDYMAEIDYAEVIKRPWFRNGIKRLLELTADQTTCIMCSEKDPASCHRHHLIARFLMTRHPEVTVMHIMPDGSLVEARSIPIGEYQADQQEPGF
jgi:uncharacterized protein (DUF488 family)